MSANALTQPSPRDPLGRTPISAGMKQMIDRELSALPTYKRGAVVVLANETGGRAHLAARIGDKWKIAGGLGVPWKEHRPTGWVGVEFAW